jgi:hypothetical protein
VTYLVALLVLLVNDHVLKDAFPGFITGKLSDFAGLFAFATFFASAFPRRAAAICVATGALFVWWKSPWSQMFVDALQLSRVVDWSDLFALIVLPFAYRTATRDPIVWKPLLAGVSIVAFAATSDGRQRLLIPDDDSLRAYATPYDKRQLKNRFENCAIDATFHKDWLLLHYRSKSAPTARWVYAHADLRETPSGIELDFRSIRIDRKYASDEGMLRHDLSQLLDSCFRR